LGETCPKPLESFCANGGYQLSVLVIYVGSKACVCMVGLLVAMSLSRLHSCVLRLVILKGGYIFSIFCLGVVKVVDICLSGFLFTGGVVISCYE